MCYIKDVFIFVHIYLYMRDLRECVKEGGRKEGNCLPASIGTVQRPSSAAAARASDLFPLVSSGRLLLLPA